MPIVAIKRATPSYGGHEAEMEQDRKVRSDVRDRAAYVYVTGQFPSHLRSNYMSILRAITSTFAKPVAMDGRSGSIKLDDVAVRDLELEAHPMVREVRKRVSEGYLIHPSRGLQARRPFGKVFMYRPRGRHGNDLIVVTSEGAVKQGWD